MNRIVLDTNVIVSALITPNGNAAKIIDFAFSGEKQRLRYCSEIIDEYREVISRPKFNLSVKTQEFMLNSLKQAGKEIIPIISEISFIDKKDRKFYDKAVVGKAILITGNGKHFPAEDFIMSPAEFIERYL